MKPTIIGQNFGLGFINYSNHCTSQNHFIITTSKFRNSTFLLNQDLFLTFQGVVLSVGGEEQEQALMIREDPLLKE